MSKEEMFRKVYINGDEKNLPKEGTEVVYFRPIYGTFIDHYRNKDRKTWMDNVKWYYAPIEQPSEADSKESVQICETCEHRFLPQHFPPCTECNKAYSKYESSDLSQATDHLPDIRKVIEPTKHKREKIHRLLVSVLEYYKTLWEGEPRDNDTVADSFLSEFPSIRNEFISEEPTKTAEEILDRRCFLNDCYMDDRHRTTAIEVAEEYADIISSNTQRIFTRPAEALKPIEELYRQEHPKGGFYIPDRTEFYKWIAEKMLNQAVQLPNNTAPIVITSLIQDKTCSCAKSEYVYLRDGNCICAACGGLCNFVNPTT